MSGETFEWWKSMVEKNPDSIIISAHHYMLKNTTVASGDWEGMRKDNKGEWKSHYHGFKPKGTPIGASYLYFVGSKPDSGAFENFLKDHQSSVAFWLGGHTHTPPDDTYGDKSHVETQWGTHFINAASLSKYHGTTCVPQSRVMTFEEGSTKVRIRCYMHDDKPYPEGWYDKAERVVELSKPFRMAAR